MKDLGTSLVFLVLSFSLTVNLRADIQQIDLEGFGPESISLSIPGAENVAIGDFFSRWGIRLSGVDSTPVGKTFVPPINVLPPRITTIFNQPDDASSAGRPLIMSFEQPVKRIGFSLLSDEDDTVVTIRTFDDAGAVIGQLEEIQLDMLSPQPGGFGEFLGIETECPQGISKVTISYGDSEQAEWISGLFLEFVSRPSFRVFIPQIGSGRLPGGAFSTTLSILNLSHTTAMTSVSFFDSNGQPLALPLADGSDQQVVEVSLDSGNSATFKTAVLEDELVIGYAKIESRVPVEAAAVFITHDINGKVVAQSGIDGAKSSVRAAGYFLRSISSGTIGPVLQAQEEDTAIAIVNASDGTAGVTIRLQGESDSLSFSSGLDLAPGQHLARFLSELFPELSDLNIRGSIVLTSDQPVVSTALQTSGGLAVSSLPVKTTQR